MGHHTIKSAGHHGITKELEEQLLPILKANISLIFLVVKESYGWIELNFIEFIEFFSG